MVSTGKEKAGVAREWEWSDTPPGEEPPPGAQDTSTPVPGQKLSLISQTCLLSYPMEIFTSVQKVAVVIKTGQSRQGDLIFNIITAICLLMAPSQLSST